MPELLPPLRDRIKPGVRVLFVGINPGIRSSLTGHHFAGFSNRFWTLLFESGLVPERITYKDDDRLPEFGYGITNIVPRPTPGIDTIAPRRIRRRSDAAAAEDPSLPPADRGDGRRHGVSRDVSASARTAVKLGPQRERIGDTEVFVLPNPSGRNANFTYAEMLAAFRKLKRRLP